MKYQVSVPVMCRVFVEVGSEVELERDDLIDAAIGPFDIESNDKTIWVAGKSKSRPTIECEGIWDDEELIYIEEIN